MVDLRRKTGENPFELLPFGALRGDGDSVILLSSVINELG